MSAQGSSRSGNALVRWAVFGRAILTDFARLALLAVCALLLGWLLNHARSEPLATTYRSPAERLRQAVGASQSGAATAVSVATPAPVDLQTFERFVRTRSGLVIDARTEGFYQHGHIPGAINLPRETFLSAFESQRTALEASKAEPVVVYCAEEDCADAQLVAEALARMGFTRLQVYRGGWEEWVQAGLPQEESAPR